MASSGEAIVVVDMQTGFMNALTRHLPAGTAAFFRKKHFKHRVFTRFVNPYSVFSTGELDDWLTVNNITEAHICGVYTNVSVLSAAGGLFDRRVRPIVVSDLCGSASGGKYHTAGLENLKKWVGEGNVLTAAQILAA